MSRDECEICGLPVLAVPNERTLCAQHLFTEEFPALAELADRAREQETTP